MEKDLQHAAVASIEITEPGERLGLPLAGDDDGALAAGVDAGFAAWRTAMAGETAREVAAWRADMDIVW